MGEALTISAPATSANLGPGFDALAVALDLSNVITVVPRPGPIEVAVEGEGAGELPSDAHNLVWRALAMGLGNVDGYEIRCRNRIPLCRGLGSSAAAVCAGLVAANALGGLRWSPEDILARAAEMEGHADNAAACLKGGMVSVAPDAVAVPVSVPDDLSFVTVVSEARVSTHEARGALPTTVPLADAAATLGRAVQLVLALSDGDLDRLPALLVDRLHEPSREAHVPGLHALRALVGDGGCLGATISGSGPTVLLWVRAHAAENVARSALGVLAAEGISADVAVRIPVAVGVRARWGGAPDARLARAVG